MALALVLLAALVVGVFIFTLGQTLPPLVASNFGAAGQANAFMPRSAFVGIMLFVGCFVPVLIWLLTSVAARKGIARIPNAAHWLSPANRVQTFAFLQNANAAFAIALAGFIGFVFWLVVIANRSAPPILPFWPFAAALGSFIAFTVGWVANLALRFRRPP
jgi:hypothetical protein